MLPLNGDPPLPPRRHAKPIVKWAGAKRWLVPLVCEGIYQRLAVTRGRYIEPFLGGGAIALDLGLPDMILGDTCRPLVGMYDAVRRRPRDVAWALQALAAKGTDRQSYLNVRSTNYPSPILGAARFIYLNKYGFNGIYRENRKGQYNVPYGDAERGARKTGVLPTLEDIEAVAAALTSVDLRVRGYQVTLAEAREGDVVYADSPYLGTYSDYTAEGFTEQNHVELAERLRAASEVGAVILATNSDNARIRELYSWAFITPVVERHTVGATVARRGNVAAVLIASDQSVLRPGD
jgi:DNA adenine methylase